jgi:hypothetical protein
LTITSTPRVTTRVAKTPVVDGRTRLLKISSIWSGRPTSRLSVTSASKNSRPLAGRSKTSVRETSIWRMDRSHQYPAARSAGVNGSGSRAHHRSANTVMVPGPSRSQIRCNPAGSVVLAKLFDPAARGVTPMPARAA